MGDQWIILLKLIKKLHIKNSASQWDPTNPNILALSYISYIYLCAVVIQEVNVFMASIICIPIYLESENVRARIGLWNRQIFPKIILAVGFLLQKKL